MCLLMNSPFPTKIFCKRMLVCYPIAFGNPKLTPYACDSIFRYSREITLSASEFPDEACLIDIIRFNISEFLHNLGATSEGLPFFCDNGKSPKGEKLYNIYLFRSFCVGEKSDSEVIRVTVRLKQSDESLLLNPLKTVFLSWRIEVNLFTPKFPFL